LYRSAVAVQRYNPLFIRAMRPAPGLLLAGEVRAVVKGIRQTACGKSADMAAMLLHM